MALPRAAVGADGPGRDVTPRCSTEPEEGQNPGGDTEFCAMSSETSDEAAQLQEAIICRVPVPLIQELVTEVDADTPTWLE